MRLIGVVLTLGLTLAPLAVEAQQAANARRIGVLVPAEPASPTEPHLAAFRQGLRALGYVEGPNVVVEYRYAHGKAAVYAELITLLVGLNGAVVVVVPGARPSAAKSV